MCRSISLHQVLGQCLEVLRANQQKLSAAGAPGTKKKLALVPFRHSKLTEIFQNFFVGDGRAVRQVSCLRSSQLMERS